MSKSYLEHTENTQQHLWQRRSDSLFNAELSQRYHRKRERFFAFLDRLAKAIAVCGGSAAAASAIKGDVAVAVAILVTVTSTFSLVFAWGDAARRHGELAADFARLSANVTAKGERTFEERDLDDFDAKLHELAAKEPAQFSALVRLIQNEMKRARKQEAEPLAWYQRYTAHLIDWQLTSK
jgi:hypothetical protein